jgi:L-fuconolactonase
MKPTSLNRRTFLSATAAAVALNSLSSARTIAMLPVIDTHQHLLETSQLKISWLKKGDPLAKPHTPVEYAAAIKGLNVVKSIYMEVAVDAEDKDKEADLVIGLCEAKSTTMVAAVIGGLPASDGFAEYVKKYKGSKYVKGVRQVIHDDSTPPGYSQKKEFIKGVQLLGESGLSFDICIRPEELPDAAKLIDACPGTRFILDHCGNAKVHHTAKERDQWKKDMTEVAKRKHVVCKVSGFVASSQPGQWKRDDLAPVINHTIEAFGWDRVMFGGDWPVCTKAASYSEWLTALREIVAEQPEANQKKLFHDNAAAFYGV